MHFGIVLNRRGICIRVYTPFNTSAWLRWRWPLLRLLNCQPSGQRRGRFWRPFFKSRRSLTPAHKLSSWSVACPFNTSKRVALLTVGSGWRWLEDGWTVGNPAGPNSGTPNAIWAVSLPQTLVGNPHGRSEIHFSLHTHLFKDEQPFFQAFTGLGEEIKKRVKSRSHHLVQKLFTF